MSLARHLDKHHLVSDVMYVGLERHPQHNLHKNQSSGAGCVISFIPHEPCEAKDIVDCLQVFKNTVSFGGVGSVVEIPSLHSHASVPDVHKGRLRFDKNLIRLSCGLDHAQDLIKDLDHALTHAYTKAQSRLRRLQFENEASVGFDATK